MSGDPFDRFGETGPVTLGDVERMLVALDVPYEVDDDPAGDGILLTVVTDASGAVIDGEHRLDPSQ